MFYNNEYFEQTYPPVYRQEEEERFLPLAIGLGLGSLGYGRPFYGGYGYGYGRPFYGGFGYGRPFYGGFGYGRPFYRRRRFGYRPWY